MLANGRAYQGVGSIILNDQSEHTIIACVATAISKTAALGILECIYSSVSNASGGAKNFKHSKIDL